MTLADFEITCTTVIDAATLRAALTRFQARHARLPFALNVRRASVITTELALTRLGLDIPVHPNGGALIGEIWLQVNQEDSHA